MRAPSLSTALRYSAIVAICATASACQTVQSVTQFVDNHLDTNLTGTFVHAKPAEPEPSPKATAANTPKQSHAQPETKTKTAVASVDAPGLRGEVGSPRKSTINGLQPDDLRAPFGN